MTESATDVLVVGAGPVGLLLAAELRRHGASVRIVDKAGGPKPISKALIHHVRTQELLDAAGVTDRVRAEARPLNRVEVNAYGRHIGSWHLDRVDGPYTGPVIIGQGRTETILEGRLKELGGNVDWNTEATAIAAREDGVRVTLSSAGGDETVEAAYVVGCEGSDSLTRKTAGFAFEGERYTGEQFIQADCKIRWKRPAGASHLFLTDHGASGSQGYLMVIEMPGDIVRVFISLPDDDPPRHDDPSLDDIQAALRQLAAPEAELHDAVWLARYRTSHRTADRFRNGRLLVAGDAGHVHVPIGGQGMNTGMQDAMNLGWKLAAVARGRAPEQLLDSYSAERVPVARQLIAGTDRAYRFVLHPGRIARGVATHLGPWLLGLDAVQTGFRTTLEEIGLAYRTGPITADGGCVGSVHAGDRVTDAQLTRASDLETVRLFDLMRRPHWTLLVFAGLERAPSKDVLQRIAAALEGRPVRPVLLLSEGPQPADMDVAFDGSGYAHDAFGVEDAALYLVRPDWYVGWRGPLDDDAGLGRYLATVLGPVS